MVMVDLAFSSLILDLLNLETGSNTGLEIIMKFLLNYTVSKISVKSL